MAFEYCDKDGDGVIGTSDLREMLAENGCNAKDKELTLIMHKFDKDQDMKISISEFIDEISPKITIWFIFGLFIQYRWE